MSAVYEALVSLVKLWPLLIVVFAISVAGIKLIVRADTNKRLFNSNGNNLYVLAVDYKKGMADMIKHVDGMCEEHRNACRGAVCLKIDTVMEKLEKMDKDRQVARVESNRLINDHTDELKDVGKEVSELVGRFNTFEKTMIRTNGNHK